MEARDPCFFITRIEETNDRLSQIVVVKVAPRANRADGASVCKTLGITNRQARHAAVGIVDEVVE